MSSEEFEELHEPKIIGAPEKIWLVYGDIDEDVHHIDCDEVSWCDDSTSNADVPYIREDLYIAERARADALKQTLYDEIDENLRLRELGGAHPDENMTAFLERVFAERDELRERNARLVGAIAYVPHDIDCAYVIHAGPVTRYGEAPCNCWKRTALEGK